MILSTAAQRCNGSDSARAATTAVALLGDWHLASSLAHQLQNGQDAVTRYYSSLDELRSELTVSQPELIVALSACWRPAYDLAAQNWCRAAQVALLRVSIWQHEAVIGPLVLPGVPGCIECAERRRLRALLRDPVNERRFLAHCQDDAAMAKRAANPWASSHALNAISALAALEVEAFITRRASHTQAHTLRFVQLRSLTSNCHRFLPDPLCPHCGQPVEDRAEDAVLRFVPRPRPDSHSYRLRSLTADLERLEDLYVDARLGIQFEPIPDTRTGSASFATTYTHYYEYPQVLQHVAGSGFTPSFPASRATAIAEVLERYCGLLPRGKRSGVYGSYRQLREQALDPEQLGLYSPEQYTLLSSKRTHPYVVPYHPDLACYWVWGYSLRRKQPILVPEQVGYYAAARIRPVQECFLYDSSNGCAMGSSIEEAILYGLFEALERDAFFLTWYARLALPAIDLHSTRDMFLRLAIERAERMTGFTLHAFDATTNFGLPTILCMGVNRADEAPRMICASSAHWNPDRALAGAFFEMVAGIGGERLRFPQEMERGERLVRDSSLVLQMEDHALVGAMPSAFSRMSFLLQEQPLQSMQQRFARQYATPPSPDLTEDLEQLAGRILDCGYDIVIVDQTAPELQAAELHCVRVLVPGLVPMAFGYDFRRLHGIERLYRLPMEMGYTDHVLTGAELNPFPHPFP